MPDTAQLSVVISAYNNADQIQDCLKSVAFADEIIVVDNHSTDSTAQLARDRGAIVLSQPNRPDMLNVNKNYGFARATGDWILSLDTDERVESDLQADIEHVLQTGAERLENGFLIPRKNIIFGKWIRHGLWYHDHQLRLFRRGHGRFAEVHNHELLKVDGQVGYVKSHLTHFNYQTVSQYLQKIDKQYSDNEAQVFIKKGKKVDWHDALRFPFQDFLTNYFAREGYKDGLHGLVLALLQAFYMFVVFCKIWEQQDFKPTAASLRQTETELKRLNRQFRYWFIRERSKTADISEYLLLKLKSWF